MRNKVAAVFVLISVIISSVLCCGCSGSGDSKEIPKIDVNGPVIMGRFGDEDIEWMVLDVKDGKALLLSKYAIDARAYNTTNRKITWKLCSMRTWLNSDFYKNAFTSGEKQIILKTELPDEKVTDRIFLLSEDEVHKYLRSPREIRVAYPTRYAMDRGIEIWIDGTSQCWLRTKGYWDNEAKVATENDFMTSDEKVSENYHGVRPAMWVSIDN